MPATIPPRPRSEAQRAASRANGARSCGPRTAEGKARSARNAFRHGLCSPAILAPGEDPAAFERLLAELRAEYRPASPSEVLLVERLAIAFWKLARCDRLEARLATIEPHCPPGRLWPDPGLPRLLSRVPELATLLRHQAQLGREVHRLTRLLATRPGAPDAPDLDPAEPSDTDSPSTVMVGPRADHPAPPSSSLAPDPGTQPPASRVIPGLDPGIQSSWMAGSPAGHDTKEEGLTASPVMVGSRADHPAPPSSSLAPDPGTQPPASRVIPGLDPGIQSAPPSSPGPDPRIQPSWMAGSPAGHDGKGDGPLTSSPVMVGPRADHPGSSPPSSPGSDPRLQPPASPVIPGLDPGIQPSASRVIPGPRPGDPALPDGRLSGRP